MLKEYLINISYISVISTIGFFILKHYLTKRIDTSFNKEIEKTKFDLQRKISNFKLFSDKKHLIYSSLYKKTCIAEGKLKAMY